MGKQMIYIHKDIDPLFKVEKNKSKLVNQLLRFHYENNSVSVEAKIEIEPKDESQPIPATKREDLGKPEGAIDGRIDEPELQLVDGATHANPGGDAGDVKWN